MPKPAVEYIPWDPESPQHIERLIVQRKHCGWNAHRVKQEWRDAHMAGSKCIYWLVFSKNESRRETYTEEHVKVYPDEKEPLWDTSKVLLGQPIKPSMSQFHPIGHIALDSEDHSVGKYDLDLPRNDSFWIKGLYVSYALQGLGIGGSALDQAETIATKEPLNARHLLLDTLHKEDQLNKEIAMAYFGEMPKLINVDWYSRKGYRTVGTVSGFYQEEDRHGVIWPMRTVFMRKDIA